MNTLNSRWSITVVITGALAMFWAGQSVYAIGIGACCLPDETCANGVTQNECEGSFSGLYQGDNSTCGGVVCGFFETGACCFPDFTCAEVLTLNDCEVISGGVWQGLDVTCSEAFCDPGTSIGACCLSNGGCMDDVTPVECEQNLGGTFAGDFTFCFEKVCFLFNFGACCLPDGTCADGFTISECEFNFGGVYQGDDSLCSGIPPCNGQDIGACCFGANCQDGFTQSDCQNASGAWQEPGSTCTPTLCGQSNPVNDNCANAIPIGEVTSLSFSNVGATTDGPDEPGVCNFFGYTQVDSDIWYCYTPSCTGNATIALCGSGYDTKLAVYDGCVCPVGASAIACNDDDCGGSLQSQVIVPVVAGQSLLIRIGGYQGDQGSGFLDISCAGTQPTGACCLPDGQCLDNQTVTNCTSTSGASYNGDGTVCASSFCPGPVGACCFDDGICIDAVSASACGNANGTYQGNDNDCVAVSCPSTPGACCLPDGTCSDGESLESCQAQFGFFQGQGSQCMSVSCPSPEGACCLAPTNDCIATTESDCTSQGGTYQGDLTSCEFNDCDLGACCLEDGNCVIADSILCMLYTGIFQGVLTDCATADCSAPVGACCDGSGSCTESTADDCDLIGGSFLGNGSSCAPDPCAVGACCPLDGGCVEIDEASCAAGGGSFAGAGTICADISCPVGACCFSDGSCIETSESACLQDNGTYLGDDTLCDDAPCVVGACCQMGNCFETTLSNCDAMSGTYLGNFSSCLDVDCGLGACCESDGTCMETDAISCAGDYRGDGTTCLSESCNEPLGGCCLPDGFCQDGLTADDCAIFDGDYLGDGSLCVDFACFVPCGSVIGDMDTSCFRDGLDIQVFTDCALNGSSPDGSCECGDYDQSGDVNVDDVDMFVIDLIVGGGTGPMKNPEGVISVTEVPSPEPCSVENPKEHKIVASWSSPECGIERIRIINLTTGQLLAEDTFPFCPTVMALEATAVIDLDDVIQTTVLTCGGDINHPCCPGPATDEVKSCPIKGADYLGISDEQRSNREMRTLTCAGAPAGSVWSRTKNGEGDITRAMHTGATYPVTATHESTPVDDIGINRQHVDPDGDQSFSDSNLTVIGIDMKIHQPKVLDSTESTIADVDELTKGAVTFVNLDNDDKDTLWDHGGAMPDEDVPGEDEMCKVRLRIKPEGLPENCGNLVLTAYEGAGDIMVWQQRNKTVEYVLGTDIPVPGDLIERDGWLEKDLWIEGIAPHTMQRDTKLRLTFDRKPNQTDEVAITLVGIDKIEWIGRSNSNADNNTLDTDDNFPGGLNPGALRVFPGARVTGMPPMLEANPRDTVDVKVTLSVAPLAGQPVKVFFKSFDVDDPTASMGPVDDEANDEDNRGTVPARRGQFVKADGTSDEDADGIKEQEFDAIEETFRFRVTMQPGDNFRIVGNGDKDALKDLENRESTLGAANADKQRIINPMVNGNAAAKEIRDPGDYASNVLTVWRRLHVERDRMGAFPAAPNIQSNDIVRQITSISGNMNVARRIDVSASIPIMMDTNGNGAGDTMDNSTLLSAGGTGRYQGGTVRIGTNMVATGNLDGNDTMFIRKNAGISIPAIVSNPPLLNAVGNVIALNGRVFTIRVTANALQAGHAGGNLNVAGVNMTIAAVNVGNSTVTVTANPVIMISLRDDDAAGPPAANRFTLMQDSDMAAQNLYAPAYIQPVFDGGGAAANETNNVAAILNTEFSAVFSWNSRANNTNRYWVVYTLSAWQDSASNIRLDWDSNAESGTGGSLGLGGSIGTLVYMETIRERGPTAGGGVNALEDRIVVHEVGHQMRLNHGSMPMMNNFAANGIMNGSAQQNPGANQLFIPTHLNQLRSLNVPR